MPFKYIQILIIIACPLLPLWSFIGWKQLAQLEKKWTAIAQDIID